MGVVNQKDPHLEPLDEVVGRMRRAVELFGRERVLFTPDCGFATFADNPVTASDVAEQKLAVIARAAGAVRSSR